MMKAKITEWAMCASPAVLVGLMVIILHIAG